MKSTFKILLGIACFALIGLTSSCSKTGVSGGLKGWYATIDDIPTEADFAKINSALDNNELVYRKTYYNFPTVETYARDIDFFWDGVFWTHEYTYGTLEDEPAGFDFFYNAINIIDNNTLIFYAGGNLYNPEYLNDDSIVLEKIYTGKHLGTLVYAIDPNDDGSYYTYKREGNKLYLNDFDEDGLVIYTITDQGLVRDGSSLLFKKFNRIKTF
ncbi:MAG: hypothetical protein II318_02435 [Bacteroidales bacterium]|nr:hypothetical protein [Bacteroidales bacterium]